MMTQDELVALFQQRLSLQQMPILVSSKDQTLMEQPRVYSISQHYHHSAHIGSQASPTATSEAFGADKCLAERVLCEHGVDIGALDPLQIELFQTADADQQRRLIELWRICGSRDQEDVGQARSSSSSSKSDSMDLTNSAEPYMTAGYEEDSQFRSESAVGMERPKYSHATDPAYKSALDFCDDWSAHIAQRQQTLGSQSEPRNVHASFYGCVDEDEEMIL